MKLEPKNDGIDHVNIYSKGKTQLGRFLSNFTYSPINTEDGTFSSIEAYWYWLGSSRESSREDLRNMFGPEAKNFGKRLQSGARLSIEVFQNKIKAAMTQKLTNNPEMADSLRKCKLKLTHYYVFGEKIRRIPKHNWLVDFYSSFQDINSLESLNGSSEEHNGPSSPDMSRKIKI